jgi:hypothetical protein
MILSAVFFGSLGIAPLRTSSALFYLARRAKLPIPAQEKDLNIFE